MKSESEVTQSCLTFSDPMDCSQPGSSIHVIFQARALEWVAISLSIPLCYDYTFIRKSVSLPVQLEIGRIQELKDLANSCPIIGYHPTF